MFMFMFMCVLKWKHAMPDSSTIAIPVTIPSTIPSAPRPNQTKPRHATPPPES